MALTKEKNEKKDSLKQTVLAARGVRENKRAKKISGQNFRFFPSGYNVAAVSISLDSPQNINLEMLQLF